MVGGSDPAPEAHAGAHQHGPPEAGADANDSLQANPDAPVLPDAAHAAGMFFMVQQKVVVAAGAVTRLLESLDWSCSSSKQ